MSGHRLTRDGRDVVYLRHGTGRTNPFDFGLVCEGGTSETLDKKEVLSFLGRVLEVVLTETDGWMWIVVDVERLERGRVKEWHEKPE